MKDELKTLLDVAENFDIFVKKFSASKLDQRFELLSDEHCLLFKKIFECFGVEKLSAIIELLPSVFQDDEEIYPIEEIILCVRDLYRSNQEKSKEILGQLFMIAPENIFYKNEIAALCPYVTPGYFRSFIDKMSCKILPFIFFNVFETKGEPVHALYIVLKNQGSVACDHLLKRFDHESHKHLTAELCKFISSSPLYEKMIKFPGDHIITIIDFVKDVITEAKIKSLFIENLERIPYQALISLLSSLSLINRKTLILSRLVDFNQTIILERIAIQVKSNIIHFLEMMVLFPDPEDRFSLFTQPIKYRSNISYSNDPSMNSLATGLSNFAGMIPMLGSHAKAAVQSFQSEQDITEFLLSHLLRCNPDLYKALAGVLSGLYPRQHTMILKEEDSSGHNLFFHAMANCPKQDILDILGASAYHTQDSEKLLSLTEDKLDSLRGMLKNSAEGAGRVGLTAFLNIYNYLAIRSMEPDKVTYQQSKDEFSILISTLKKNQFAPSLHDVYNRHCQQHPLRKAKAVQLASSAIQFGTNRHYDARKLLGTLSDREMKEGLHYFNAFLLARREVYSYIALDIEALLIALRRYLNDNDNPGLFEINSRSRLSEILYLKNQYIGRRPDQVLPILDTIIMRRMKFEDAGFSEEYDKALLNILNSSDIKRSSLSIP